MTIYMDVGIGDPEGPWPPLFSTLCKSAPVKPKNSHSKSKSTLLAYFLCPNSQRKMKYKTKIIIMAFYVDDCKQVFRNCVLPMEKTIIFG